MKTTEDTGDAEEEKDFENCHPERSPPRRAESRDLAVAFS